MKIQQSVNRGSKNHQEINIIIDALRNSRRKKKTKQSDSELSDPTDTSEAPLTLEKLAQTVKPTMYPPTAVQIVNPAGLPQPTMFDLQRQNQMNTILYKQDALRQNLEDMKMDLQPMIEQLLASGNTQQANTVAQSLSGLESVVDQDPSGMSVSDIQSLVGESNQDQPYLSNEYIQNVMSLNDSIPSYDDMFPQARYTQTIDSAVPSPSQAQLPIEESESEDQLSPMSPIDTPSQQWIYNTPQRQVKPSTSLTNPLYNRDDVDEGETPQNLDVLSRTNALENIVGQNLLQNNMDISVQAQYDQLSKDIEARYESLYPKKENGVTGEARAMMSLKLTKKDLVKERERFKDDARQFIGNYIDDAVVGEYQKWQANQQIQFIFGSRKKAPDFMKAIRKIVRANNESLFLKQ
jgi:hypothetical protein